MYYEKYYFFLLVILQLFGGATILAQNTTNTTADSLLLSFTFDKDIVVTGQYAPTDIKSSVLPIRIITKEMIAKRAATNLTEILQQDPAVRIQYDAVLGTQITMNGLQGQHVKVLLDGVPMIGRSSGNLDLDRIQVQNIERIEIIENAMSVAYGTNALGGTINIITKKKYDKIWNAKILGQVQSNQQYDLNANFGVNYQGFSASLEYNFSRFSGFSTDTLRSEQWNPKTQHALAAQLHYNLPKSSISLGYQFRYLDENIDNKGIIKLGAFPELSYAKDYAFLTKTQDHSLHALGYVDKKKKYYLDAIVSFNNFVREKNAYFRSLNQNPDPDRLDSLDSDTTSFQAWNIRATLASQYHKKIDFQVGLDIRYDYTTGDRIKNNRAELGDYAIFLSANYKPFAALNFNAGIRVAYNTLAKVPVTYSAGLKWKITDGMNLRASYARGIRTPSLKELYLNFVDINHDIVGNPNLQPEYAHNVRLGWSLNKAYQREHIVGVDVGGFYNYIEQQIALFSYDLDSLGNYVMNATANKYAYFNVDEYQNWGLNAKVKYQYRGLTINFGTVFTGHYNAINEAFPEQVDPFQYTIEFSQELSYRFSKIDLSLSLFRRDYDKIVRYTAQTNPFTQEVEVIQTTLDGYALMDFTISKGFWNQGLVVSAGIKNILDVQDINQSGGVITPHGGGGGSLAVGMGRIYFVRLLIQPFLIGKK